VGNRGDVRLENRPHPNARPVASTRASMPFPLRPFGRWFLLRAFALPDLETVSFNRPSRYA